MEIQFNIRQLFNYIWGFNYIGVPFPLGKEAFGQLLPELPGTPDGSAYLLQTNLVPDLETKKYSSTGAVYKYKDTLGRWVFMPVRFQTVNKSEEWEIPNAVLRFTCTKNIVESMLTSRKGSVKELISMDDYQIDMKAIIVAKDKVFPETEIKKIRTWWDKNEGIRLLSAISDIFLEEDDNVVITNLSIPDVRLENVFAFEMSMKSDKSFELIIN